INMDGNMKITDTILISAPLAISVQRELIISMFEYNPTPKVAAKKDNALTTIDFTLLWHAIVTASLFSTPSYRSFLYLVVISIA
ncbi:hypothetical protein M2T62_30415, partial [Klebsiella pneumoniae]